MIPKFPKPPCLKSLLMLGNFQQLSENRPSFKLIFTLNPTSYHWNPNLGWKLGILVVIKLRIGHHENFASFFLLK